MTLDQLPELARAARLADETHEIVVSIQIDAPEMFAIAGDELKAITGRYKAIEDLRLSITRPIDESKKRVMDLFREPLERLKADENHLRSGMLEYQRVEREKADAIRRSAEEVARKERVEQQRIQREAEDARRVAQEAAKAATNAAERQKAEEAMVEAELRAEEAEQAIELAEIAPPALPVAATPKVAGIASRETWKAEVVDLEQLVIAAATGLATGDKTLFAYLQADTKALGSVAKALKTKARIPGVRIYSETGLSVRAA